MLSSLARIQERLGKAQGDRGLYARHYVEDVTDLLGEMHAVSGDLQSVRCELERMQRRLNRALVRCSGDELEEHDPGEKPPSKG